MQQDKVYSWFIKLSLVLLLLGLVFGVVASVSFVGANYLTPYIPFQKLRPMHVSAVFFWILTAAVGGIIFYSKKYFGEEHKPAPIAMKTHFWLWLIALAGIFTSYFLGKFGGREYFEYPPGWSIPVLVGWLLFSVYFLSHIYKTRSISKPVYIWMWSTGALFFTLTFLESNLWNIEWFRNNIIRDITVQWKANGAMVGAWNMLIYGTSFYLMQQISGDERSAFSKGAFFFYFLGFTNLLFNWGHHTYVVPAAPWVRHVSYIISMTEWVVLLNILRNWRKTLTDAKKHLHLLPYWFLFASEVWIFINLFLALLMSIPAINVYTHGTHITVAHSMGTTIGINSMILFASLFFIAEERKNIFNIRHLRIAFWLMQISLLIFFLSLVAAGLVKGYLVTAQGHKQFHEVMNQVYPYINVFAVSGVFLMVGMGWVAFLLLKAYVRKAEV